MGGRLKRERERTTKERPEDSASIVLRKTAVVMSEDLL